MKVSPAPTESGGDNFKMQNHCTIRPYYNTRTRKFDWNMKCNCRGSNTCSSLCERTTNASDKMPAKKPNASQGNIHPKPLQRRDPLVDQQTFTVEWEADIIPGSRYSTGNRRLTERVGVSLPTNGNKNRGSLGFPRKENAHKCIGNESSGNSSEIGYKGQVKSSRTCKSRQCYSNQIHKQNGRDQISKSDKHSKTNMGILPKKEITLTAEHLPGSLNHIADWESRHVSSPLSSNNWKLNPEVFKQINSIMGPICLDLFAERRNAQVERFISWKRDPLAIGTDAFLTTWEGKDAYAFLPFCLIPRCLAKVQKEKAQMVIITPAWQSQAFYPSLLEMSVQSPILLPPQKDLLQSPRGEFHPLILNKTLKLVAWKISGNQKSCRDFQLKAQNYCSQRGGKALSRLTTAAGDSGLAGVVRDKLILFRPLWKIERIFCQTCSSVVMNTEL